MRAVVRYESMFGNSERVARAVADGLAETCDAVDVEDVTVATPDVGADTDLLVVGGPTHAFSMSRTNTREDAIRQGAMHGLANRGLREWIAALPDDLHALPCAAFDTRVSRVRKLPGSAARSAARAVRRRRGHVVVPPASFYVDDVAGPLAPDELDQARAWGRRLGELLAERERATAS